MRKSFQIIIAISLLLVISLTKTEAASEAGDRTYSPFSEVLKEISGRIDNDLAINNDQLSAGNFGTLVAIVIMVINVLIWFGFLFGIIGIAFSAIKYILSGGDPEKTQEAWRAFLYGSIAAMLALGAVTIKVAVLKLFGVDTTGVSILEGGGF